jgi:ATP-binding cassette subfamily B protein
MPESPVTHGDHLHRGILHKVFGYLPHFLAFVYRRFPLVRVLLPLTLATVALEYAALSLMIPLTGASSRLGAAGIISGFWTSVATRIGAPATQSTWLWLFVVVMAFRVSTGFVQAAMNTYAAKQIHAFLSNHVFSRIVAVEPLQNVYHKSIGFYVALAGDETSKAGSIFSYFVQIVTSGLSAAAGLIVLACYSGTAFLLTLGFLGVCVLLLSRSVKAVLKVSARSLLLSRSLNTNFIDALNGLRSVRSLTAERFVIGVYRDQIRRYVRDLFLIDAVNQGSKAVPALILLMIAIFWLWPGRSDPTNQTLFFFALTTLLIRVMSSLGEMVTAAGKMLADIRGSAGARELLSSGEAASTGNDGRVLPNHIEVIEVRNFTCGYSRDSPILRSVSVKFAAGRAYALVGESGSGKSTLADCLLGFVRGDSGDILIDGASIRTIRGESLRSRILLVEQQSRLFTGSLRENLTMGGNFSTSEIQRSIEVAGLREFISGLSDGLDTILQYQGANLSGGQRQRIGIARAVLRRPAALILDEATNALDPVMRKAVLHALRSEFRTGIIVFITHDADLLDSVDEVWRIAAGTCERSSIDGATFSDGDRSVRALSNP